MNLALKKKIIDSGRPQIALAREIKIPEPHLSKIVNGWVNPKDELKEKIARVLGCIPADIFPDNNNTKEVS